MATAKKAAPTNGRKKIRKAARRAADTRLIRDAIRKAKKHLEAALKELEKADKRAAPGKRPIRSE